MITQTPIFSETVNYGKTDKIARYGWSIQDTPGEFTEISKSELLIPAEYQRDVVLSKVYEICAKWSWFGCGVLIVANRDGKYWVVDGQHRVLAALRRSDINVLPCMVFDTSDLASEAQAFVTVNTGRKPVAALDKMKALSVSGDPDAEFLIETLANLGLNMAKTANKGLDIKCIGVCHQMVKTNRQHFMAAITLAAKLSANDNTPISEKILSSLFYFESHLPYGLDTPKFRQRVLQIGNIALLEAATRAAAYFAGGGMKVWAEGALSLINKGLRTDYVLTNTAG